MRISPEQYKLKLREVINEELSDDAVDATSHFILRLAYCQSEELRRWFLQQESALLQHRLSELSDKQLAQSVRKYTQVEPISKHEKEAFQEPLLQFMNPTEFATTTFYAVPFTQALDLVAKRQCYLHRGRAFVPQHRVVSILLHKFRAELSRQLVTMTLETQQSDEGVRVLPLLKNLHSCLTQPEPTESGNALASLTATSVPQYTQHMPLCMRQLQTGLQQDKKLKHWGRQQYGLFLKAAGLSMDDALAFFQRSFSRMTGEEFQKQYSYNIRHMYGKEGKRANYTAYNCSKIILGNAPNVGDHHGCPYKHYDAEHLATLLRQLNIGNESDRRAIVGLKKSHQYQLACAKHFEAQHPQASSRGMELDNVGNHPNAWFRASVEYQSIGALVSPEK